MTLRAKTILILGGAFAGILLVLFLLSRVFLVASFLRLEEESARKDLGRVQEALAQTFTELDRNLWDWATWDDTYAFLESRDQEYVRINVNEGTFSSLGVNLLLFFDKEERLVWGRLFDLDLMKDRPLPPDLLKKAASGPPLLYRPGRESSRTGFAVTSEGVFFLASRPVLTSLEEGPFRGTLVMGRLLGPSAVKRLGEITHLSLEMALLPGPGASPEWVLDLDELVRPDQPLLIRPLDRGKLEGVLLTSDLWGRPAFLFRTLIPRTILQKTRMALNWLLAVQLLTGVLLGVLALFLLNRAVLARLERMNKDLVLIAANQDLSARVGVEGDDELASLGRRVNDTLVEIQKAQAETSEARERLSAVLASVQEGVIALDGNGRVVFLNAGAEALTGMGAREAEGRLISEVYSLLEEKSRKPLPPPEGAAEDPRAARPGRVGILSALGGKDRMVQETLSPLRGRWGGSVVTLRDIGTARLLDAERTRTDKLETIAHLSQGIAGDFGKALGDILDAVTRARAQGAEKEAIRRELEEIQRAAYSARGLTRQLLSYARVGNPLKRPLEARDLLEKSIRPVLKGSRVDLELAVPPGLRSLVGDPEGLGQAFSALAETAALALPGSSQLTVKVRGVQVESGEIPGLSAGPHLRIQFDGGLRFPGGLLERIFDPYAAPLNRSGGLGMAMAYSVVARHGGTILVESRPPQSTVFTAFLPEGEPGIPGIAGERSEPPGEERILLVEEDEANLRLGAEMLREWGYRVDTAADGPGGVILFRRALEEGSPYKAVLLARREGGGMGEAETLGLMRALDPGVRAALTSFLLENRVPIRFRETGFDAVLVKPFRMMEVARVLAKLLGSP